LTDYVLHQEKTPINEPL